MQKKCKPNAMELAPIAEMQPFFTKNYAKISRIAKNELFMSFSPQQR